MFICFVHFARFLKINVYLRAMPGSEHWFIIYDNKILEIIAISINRSAKEIMTV